MTKGSKNLNFDFNHLESGEGIVDMVIRFDSKTGAFEFYVEENGLPTSVPAFMIIGMLNQVATQSAFAGEEER